MRRYSHSDSALRRLSGVQPGRNLLCKTVAEEEGAALALGDVLPLVCWQTGAAGDGKERALADAGQRAVAANAAKATRNGGDHGLPQPADAWDALHGAGAHVRDG